jgi:lipopolysaccharide export system protein LptA
MRRSLSLCLLLLALVPAAMAAPAAPAASQEPLKIKSDTLHADNEKKTATFEGKVVARQGDLTLYADRLVITSASASAAAGQEVSRVEAFGNVRILQGTQQASGAHAVYEPKDARILLDGSPKVSSQGGNEITGKLITYYVNEQRSVVTGGPDERVQAIFHPGGKNAGSKP